MIRQRQQSLAECGIATETFNAADQPQVELIFRRSQIGYQLGVIPLRIIDEIAGVNLEELRQQQPRRICQVRTSSTFNLRQIRLADCSFTSFFTYDIFLLNRPNQLLLSHGAIEAPETALDLAKITDFVAEFHFDCKSQYLYRNMQ